MRSMDLGTRRDRALQVREEMFHSGDGDSDGGDVSTVSNKESDIHGVDNGGVMVMVMIVMIDRVMMAAMIMMVVMITMMIMMVDRVMMAAVMGKILILIMIFVMVMMMMIMNMIIIAEMMMMMMMEFTMVYGDNTSQMLLFLSISSFL